MSIKKDRLHGHYYQFWWPKQESNQRHRDFQSLALPTELSGHLKKIQLADQTGIEPAIFSVTGRHVNRYTTGPVAYILSYNP